MSAMETLPQLLAAVRRNEPGAVDRLFEATYAQLRSLAHQRLRRSAPVTNLDTTVLVHECYLRVVRVPGFTAEDRALFLGYAARAMRSIVVDLLRQRGAGRRGGDQIKVSLSPELEPVPTQGAEHVMRLNDALDELERLDGRLARVVEMKYFAGMTFEEIAGAMGVAERTARRDWEKARVLLHASLAS
ncbi:MAG: sigma-70 family RNA polymerase sigma factor [Proteobacteria bacterium]|nr:sigma-70 family RNA polymerase sigma factor [Pseudomonadota bacterium]